MENINFKKRIIELKESYKVVSETHNNAVALGDWNKCLLTTNQLGNIIKEMIDINKQMQLQEDKLKELRLKKFFA